MQDLAPRHAAALLALLLLSPAVHAAQAQRTPTASGAEGPYRPPPGAQWGGAQLLVAGVAPSPGTPMRVAGCVTDTAGRPMGGLTVQLWQANSTGRYNHPGETPGHGQPDPGFRGHGQVLTDATGCYAFQTLRPAGYRRTLYGLVPWRFEPHLHLAVRGDGRDLLVTQIELDDAYAAAARLPDEPAVAAAASRLAGGGRGELLRLDIVLARA